MRRWIIQRRWVIKRWAVALAVGFVMASALSLGGLTLPEVIIGWVDVFGDWDPTLLFFFGGATLTFHLLYRWALARPADCGAPVLGPPRDEVDGRLVLGSAIFGIGWALGGVCPGPAFTSLGAGAPWAFPFVATMLIGFAVGERAWLRPRPTHRSEMSPASPRTTWLRHRLASKAK